MSIICRFSDGYIHNVDSTKFKNYLDLKKYLFNLKISSKLQLNKSDDILMITLGNIILDSDIYDVKLNQVFLIKININIEVIKILNDNRLINLVSNEKSRNYIYKILENPDILNFLDTYKYQKEFDNIKDMNFNISDDKIKEYLNCSCGNIETVITSILNL
jgi:transcription initiation factor IIE alpha subunit